MNPPSLGLNVRSGAELLACVPLLFGFVPEQSVVMLALGDPTAPAARVDLGPGEDRPEIQELCSSLVSPARAHGIARVGLCIFAELDHAEAVCDALFKAFTDAGIDVALLLAYDGAAWTPLLPWDRDGFARPFDLLAHAFVAEAVVQGRVVLASREALARSLEPLPARVARTEDWLTRFDPPDAAWVRTTIATLVGTGAAPSPEQVAGLATAVARAEVRDEAWAWVSREDARSHIDLWLSVVRATPPDLVAAPAAVLAVLAWRAGDGALAWCAVDASRASGQRCSLTDLVADLLERAVSPRSWPRLRAI